MTRQLTGQWDLQEAITEQGTATRTATAPVTLCLECIYNNLPSSFAIPSSTASPLTTRASDRQRAGAGGDSKPSYRICIVEGSSVIKEFDTSKLNPGNSEVRIVPPTRATLLYSDPDEPTANGSGRGDGRALSRSSTQIDSQNASQNASQNGPQRKKRSLLKLCFLSVGDLKSASHEFMRIGLRCTSLPTADSRATLSRTSSVVSMQASSQGSQERDLSGKVTSSLARAGSFVSRTLSNQPIAHAVSMTATAMQPRRLSAGTSTTSLKRTYSEAPPGPESASRMKRRQTAMAVQDAFSPSLLQRESSSADIQLSPWPPPPANRTASRSLSRTPNMIRLGSSSAPYERERLLNSPVQTPVTPNDVDEPPPRRELPLAITRHLSQTPSQDARSASAHARRAAMADTEVQTVVPFVEPEAALLAGMNLFQELADLKNGMLKECLGVTKALGAGGNDEAEARLVARYAIEFQARFTEICARQENPYCR